MTKNLVIVESPAKARTVSRYLGKDFQVEASVGHIRDLPSKEMAVDIDNDFTPSYVIMPGKKSNEGFLWVNHEYIHPFFFSAKPNDQKNIVLYGRRQYLSM